MKIEEVTSAIMNRSLIECKFGTYITDGLLSRYNRHTGWHYSLRLLDLKTEGRSVLYADIKDCEIVKELEK